MNPVLQVKRSLKLQTDYKRCIICQLTNGDEVNNLTRRGLETFKSALETRRDEVYERLWKDLGNSDNFIARNAVCHRSCRSNYTHKKEIESIKSKRQMADLSSAQCSSQSHKKQRCYIKYNVCCFICEKARDKKGSWELIPITTENRQKEIHQKAKNLWDEDILMKIQGFGDEKIYMIASGFQYHKLCMDKFMNKRITNSTGSKVNVFEETLAILISEIEAPLLREDSVFYLTQLRDRYREILKEHNVENWKDYKVSRLQQRLVQHFGSKVNVVQEKDQPPLLCSSSLTVSKMLALATQLQQKLDDSQLLTESDESDGENILKPSIQNDSHAVAKYLRVQMKAKALEERSVVKSDMDYMSISYQEASDKIPNELYNHVAWLVADVDPCVIKEGRVSLPNATHEKVLNISQDLMANVTGLPMTKHVGLAIHVMKQTRCKDLVRILNRFGNSISYEETQRYISAMAERTELQEASDGVFIPSMPSIIWISMTLLLKE